ncbi:MAG TPA: sensor histidine kinase [Thermoanaerobaculia bacterium]|jgi:two-component system sensor histidine kinase DesK|nr:sensor histidine kinase [Thermoanaerobaculia bacterium]
MRLLPKDEPLGWTPYAWTIYVFFFLLGPVMAHVGATVWALTLLTLVVFLALYFRGWWVDGREMALIVVAMTLLGVVWMPFNPGSGTFFIYAAAFAPYIGSARTSIIAITLIEATTVAIAMLTHLSLINAVWPIVFVILIGATNMHHASAERSNARLRLAHDEIAHLAKVAERERIARDLHDLLGHTLSLIVLKSELAAKLAERDIERARAEIRDVERISRDALAEVRAAVGGFRSEGLQGEIDRAREALRAGNIALEATIDEIPLPPAREAVLALAIREGVTNIIRHAYARRCTIALSRTADGDHLLIADDGRGTSANFGNGLSGMRERVLSLGGTLTLERAGGTRLKIDLPADERIAERSA